MRTEILTSLTVSGKCSFKLSIKWIRQGCSCLAVVWLFSLTWNFNVQQSRAVILIRFLTLECSDVSLFILFVRAVDRFTMTILDFVFHCHENFNSSIRFPIVLGFLILRAVLDLLQLSNHFWHFYNMNLWSPQWSQRPPQF